MYVLTNGQGIVWFLPGSYHSNYVIGFTLDDIFNLFSYP